MTFEWLVFIVVVHSCKSHLSLTVNSVFFGFVTIQTDLEETSGHVFLKKMLGCGSMRKALVVRLLKILHGCTRCCLPPFWFLFETEFIFPICIYMNQIINLFLLIFFCRIA
jgi:hypothetical protein